MGKAIEVLSASIKSHQVWIDYKKEHPDYQGEMHGDSVFHQERIDDYNLAIKNITQLQAELEKHRWIPVSERLPKENELVLLYIRNPKSISSGSLDAYRTGFNVGNGNIFYPLKFVTHWKPIIPPPPKGTDEQ